MKKLESKSREGVTLQTIANRLGVSRTTISNAYGRPDQLAPALREKILECAKELGYAGPSAAARSLRLGRIDVIGLLTTTTLSYTVTDPAAVQLLQGFAKVFDKQALSLLTLPAPLTEEAGIESARNAVVDGFLVYGVSKDDPRLKAIVERNIPVVAIDEPMLPTIGFVGIDDRGSARTIAEFVIALGHRRIGVLSLPLSDYGFGGFANKERQKAAMYPFSSDRLDGFADALKGAGIDWDATPVYECKHNSREHGARWTGAMLDQVPRPTAIIAASDLLAFGAMRAANVRGLRVPDDLSITGFDDIPDAQFAQPPLTTIRQPLRKKGIEAARMVVEGWDSKKPPKVILPTELVVRASTGPASV
jgi:DNA-binding LacI/PurR family transcriptional regulator